MKKTVSLALAGALAVAGLGLTSDASDARHRDRDGFWWGFSYGSPHHHYRYRPYAPRYFAPPRRAFRSDWSAHVAWCHDRYRSYQAHDNTYQPFNGPRRECRSPFFG